MSPVRRLIACSGIGRPRVPGNSDERGAAAVEFALLAPVLVLLFGVTVGGARLWLARATVDHAAASAARAGSLARSAEQAVADGRALAELQLTTDGVRCAELTVELDARDLVEPAGAGGFVEAVVGCTVGLSDVLVPGWPGEVRVVATAASAVDRYRARS